jgi:hypothetical protein
LNQSAAVTAQRGRGHTFSCNPKDVRLSGRFPDAGRRPVSAARVGPAKEAARAPLKVFSAVLRLTRPELEKVLSVFIIISRQIVL